MKPGSAAAALVWTDTSTGLVWARKDNGSDVNWNEANSYCRNLNLAGSSGWRLPTIDELSAMYDASKSDTVVYDGGTYTYHIKGAIKLSGWHQWSGSQDGSGSARLFTFYHGNRFSFPLDGRFDLRALCVRSPAQPAPREPAPAGKEEVRPVGPAAALVWTDTSTGLIWATKDNGSDVNWNEADSYCRSLSVGGYSGWRLPTIEELSAMYDPSKSDTFVYDGTTYTYHIRGGIKLSGWHWSGTQEETGAAWNSSAFTLPLGSPTFPTTATAARALCVRR